MLLCILDLINAACSAIMKIEVEMTRKQQNKMADMRFKASLFIEFTDSKMCIVFVCMRYVKQFGCHYNQSGVLKIELLILLRLARFQNLGTPPSIPSADARE